MLRMGLADSPGLQLMNRIASRVEVVMMGDLRQLGGMAAPLALMVFGPAQELTLWTALASGVGREGNGGHWIGLEHLTTAQL